MGFEIIIGTKKSSTMSQPVVVPGRRKRRDGVGADDNYNVSCVAFW